MGIILMYIGLTVLISVLTCFISESKNRSNGWWISAFIFGLLLSPVAALLILLTVGMMPVKEPKEKSPVTVRLRPRSPLSAPEEV